MQSSIYLATWKSPEFHLFPTRKPFSKNLKPLPTTPPNSLRTPTGETLHQNELILLPVVVKESGRVSRYTWDGKSLKLVTLEGRKSSFLSLDVGLAIRDFFIPKRVPENYMGYVKWKFLHRVFSSALQVLATQAMFRAIGIGYSRSLPSAAALNWVLKDGLGRLSRCIYTASFASAFDTNLKRVRFSTSVLFSLTIGVELLTPAFPQYFLLLATLANAAKQISLACYLATSWTKDLFCSSGVAYQQFLSWLPHVYIWTNNPAAFDMQSAIHRSFAIADNLGEVSAKSQIQSVCFDNLGLMLAAFFNMLLKNDQRLLAGLPFFVYPIFSAIDLYGIYQGLKHVHLQTLTKDRLEIILNMWIELGCVPSPAEVSRQEGINFLWSNSKELWPIRIGGFNTTGQIPKLSVIAMQSLGSQDHHFVCLENCKGLRRAGQQGILLCLCEGAGISDIMMGLLQACCIRNALCLGRWDATAEACDASESVLDEWFKLIVDTKQRAERDMPFVLEEMSAQGWAIKNILLSTKEQSRYSFVDY